MLARRLTRKGYSSNWRQRERNWRKRVHRRRGSRLVGYRDPEITALPLENSSQALFSCPNCPLLSGHGKSQSYYIVSALDFGATILDEAIDFPVAVARMITQLAHKQRQEA